MRTQELRRITSALMVAGDWTEALYPDSGVFCKTLFAGHNQESGPDIKCQEVRVFSPVSFSIVSTSLVVHLSFSFSYFRETCFEFGRVLTILNPAFS